VLASGPGDALDRAQPIFDAIGSKTVRLEPDAGGASRRKLVRLGRGALGEPPLPAEPRSALGALAQERAPRAIGIGDSHGVREPHLPRDLALRAPHDQHQPPNLSPLLHADHTPSSHQITRSPDHQIKRGSTPARTPPDDRAQFPGFNGAAGPVFTRGPHLLRRHCKSPAAGDVGPAPRGRRVLYVGHASVGASTARTCTKSAPSRASGVAADEMPVLQRRQVCVGGRQPTRVWLLHA
jgi:hypothetical protein